MAKEIWPARPQRGAASEGRARPIEGECRVDPRQEHAFGDGRLPEPAFPDGDLPAKSVLFRKIVYAQSRAGLQDLRIFAEKRSEVGNDIERTGRVGNDVAGGVDERAGDAEIGENPLLPERQLAARLVAPDAA